MEQRAVSEFLAAAAVEPAALVLEGDAGIGKTTVWLDAMERAREAGFRVLSTRIAETESVLAYAGLAALLEGVELAAFEALPPPQRLAMDRVLLRISAEGPMTDQRAVNAGVVSLLEHLAHRSPVLVAIDDLQWLDQPSLQIVSSVARRLRGSIGVLAAVRTGPDSTRLGSWLELPRPDRLQRVALRPLSLGALHTVVSERVGRSFSRPKMHEIHAAAPRCVRDDAAHDGGRFRANGDAAVGRPCPRGAVASRHRSAPSRRADRRRTAHRRARSIGGHQPGHGIQLVHQPKDGGGQLDSHLSQAEHPLPRRAGQDHGSIRLIGKHLIRPRRSAA